MLLKGHVFIQLFLLFISSFFVLISCAEPIENQAFGGRSLDDAISAFFEEDYVSAEFLFGKGAGKYGGEAYHYLALIFAKQGDENKAIQLHINAARLGYSSSMSALSNAYAGGLGVPRDLLVAMDWQRKAKAAQRKTQQSHAVVVFDNESGKEQSGEALISHWEKQSKNGDSSAHYRLARIYDDGVLIEHNFEIALNYYKLAANNGHKESQRLMGYFSCRGIGMKKDIKGANEWFSSYGESLECH